jgi:hypothetical protein
MFIISRTVGQSQQTTNPRESDRSSLHLMSLINSYLLDDHDSDRFTHQLATFPAMINNIRRRRSVFGTLDDVSDEQSRRVERVFT